MFWRRKKSAPPPAPPERVGDDVKVAAMDQAIADRRARDPLVGVKIGGKELAARLFEAVRDERGVHAETLLAVLGALAGFACPAAAAEVMTRAGAKPRDAGLVVVEGADGRTFWFGDVLNEMLLEDEFSVWSLVAGQARALGATALPDVEAIVRHVAETVGGDAFGAIRVPDGHQPATTPIAAVQALWPTVRPILLRYCDHPQQWPLMIAMAAQEVQRAAADEFDPGVAATILMECALPMAKLAPGSPGTS